MSSNYPSNNLVRRARKPSFEISFYISNLHPQRAQKLVDLDSAEKYFLTIYGLLPMLKLPNIDRSQFPCALSAPDQVRVLLLESEGTF